MSEKHSLKETLLTPAPVEKFADTNAYSLRTRLFSCATLLIFSVSATILAEASKNSDGTYPYNTFVVPLTVEAVKLLASASQVGYHSFRGQRQIENFTPSSFSLYVVPALCYFISNNCMFFIIRELGPSTFQVTNNLKVLSTAVFMRALLSRKLTWLQVKALILLVCGSALTQSNHSTSPEDSKHSWFGYTMVIANATAAGIGGVYSERLLKGSKSQRTDSIHWQNCQLYFFGALFGIISLSADNKLEIFHLFKGFNLAAYLTVIVLAACGLLVSFILKYLDNFAKCFVGALSMIAVAIIHAFMTSEGVSLNLGIGITLTCIAIEQYNLSSTQ